MACTPDKRWSRRALRWAHQAACGLTYSCIRTRSIGPTGVSIFESLGLRDSHTHTQLYDVAFYLSTPIPCAALTSSVPCTVRPLCGFRQGLPQYMFSQLSKNIRIPELSITRTYAKVGGTRISIRNAWNLDGIYSPF